MKIKLSLLFLFILGTFSLLAQDKLYKQDGEIITVNVLEIDDEHVTYTLFSTPNGSSYKVSKAVISKIVYKNGLVEEYGTRKADGSMVPFKPASTSSGFGSNIISYELPALILANVSFAYERILADGLIGLKVPVVYGLYPYNDVWGFFQSYSIKYKTGLDLNLYPTGQGKMKFYIGPGFRFGQLIGQGRNIDGSFSFEEEYSIYNLTSFQANTGFMYTPAKNFTLTFSGFVGHRWLRHSLGYNVNNSQREIAGINLMLGFRF